MTSGMGVKGTQGRCYGFYADFKECQESAREALIESHEAVSVKRTLVGKICEPHRIDYFECLHGFKDNLRRKKVVDEIQRQDYEAKYGPRSDPQH